MKLKQFICSMLVMAVSAFSRGFVLKSIWTWFISPQFHLATLPLLVAIGIGFMPIIWSDMPSKERQSDWGTEYVFNVVLPWLVYAECWVVHLLQ